MSDPTRTPHDDAADAQLKRLLAGTARPQPAADFRARAKDAYLRAAADARAERERRATSWWTRLWPDAPASAWLVPAGAVAALVLAMSWFLAAPKPEAFAVLHVAHAEQISIDGVAMRDSAELAAKLHTGAHVQTGPDAKFEYTQGERMYVAVLPGTELLMPHAKEPGSRDWTAAVVLGETRFSTGPAFHGTRLAVSTGANVVHVVGTTFGVIRGAGGSCVCVFEGEVKVDPAGAESFAISTGHRRMMFDATGVKPLEVLPSPESQEFSALHARAVERFGGR